MRHTLQRILTFYEQKKNNSVFVIFIFESLTNDFANFKELGPGGKETNSELYKSPQANCFLCFQKVEQSKTTRTVTEIQIRGPNQLWIPNSETRNACFCMKGLKKQCSGTVAIRSKVNFGQLSGRLFGKGCSLGLRYVFLL